MQCHSRYFFNDQRKAIFCYDKVFDNFYPKLTTKSLFSEDFSNTRVHNDDLDHQTLETELNLYFENDFEKHVDNILELVANPTKMDAKKHESFYYIARYALISDTRFPFNKKKMDDAIASMIKETAYKVRLLGDEEQAKAIEKSVENERTKYSNLINYTQIAAIRLERMGSIIFRL
ncbi:MAG: hypothetical protein WD431_03795 [Cyclobacteriaceae bacterium]